MIDCNLSERSLDLVLTLDDKLQPNIAFCSTSGVELGQLPPNNTTDFSVELLPLTPGLQVLLLPFFNLISELKKNQFIGKYGDFFDRKFHYYT